MAVCQAPAARAGNQAVFNYCPASGAGPRRAYSSDQQLSVGETVTLSPRAGCARCACPVRRAGTGNRAMPNRTEATTRKPRQQPPGDYRYCACSRLHSLTKIQRNSLTPRPTAFLLCNVLCRDLAGRRSHDGPGSKFPLPDGQRARLNLRVRMILVVNQTCFRVEDAVQTFRTSGNFRAG